MKFAVGTPYFNKKQKEMTNNDKALETMPDAGCYRAWGVWAFQNKETIRQSLTRQSSADLGRVRYALERCLHFKTNDGQQQLITEALRILDEVIGWAE